MSRRSRSRRFTDAKTRVKTARGRKPSSTRWLQRQLNDPYVAAARKRGYRTRAAFKLIEIDDQFSLLAPGMRVVDLGAAPGGWTQVAVERAHSALPGHDRGNAVSLVVAVDCEVMEPVAGATVLACDMTTPEALDSVRRSFDPSLSCDQKGSGAGRVDLVLSDLSPATTGHAATDHLRIVALAESAYQCARELLVPGGGFVTKLFQGGSPDHLLHGLKTDFSSVRHFKPPASRKESPETYVIAQGFQGRTVKE